ncbi:MAG: hypothetical protein ACOC2U_01990, partial [bacterium]
MCLIVKRSTQEKIANEDIICYKWVQKSIPMGSVPKDKSLIKIPTYKAIMFHKEYEINKLYKENLEFEYIN